MIRIREIDHLVLRVRNLEKMLTFYCQGLGCSVERRQDEIGLVQLRAGRSLIDLVPVDGKLGRAGGKGPGSEGRNLDHLCLRVEPFDALAITTHLREHGASPGEVEQRGEHLSLMRARAGPFRQRFFQMKNVFLTMAQTQQVAFVSLLDGQIAFHC